MSKIDFVTVKFGCGNAAFDYGGGLPEIARLLRNIADNFERGDYEPGRSAGVWDVNGNFIGEVQTVEGDA